MVHKESGGKPVEKYGSFKKVKKTIWMPICPELGTIVAAADNVYLTPLKVKAKGNGMMELMNTRDFAGNQNFRINESPIPANTTKNREINCRSRISSVHHVRGIMETHKFAFGSTTGQKNKGRKK